MTRQIRFGNLAGLAFSAFPSAFISFIILWIVLTAIGIFLLQLTIVEALIGGLVAAISHWVADTLHQLGHARAARRTGHPMIGIRFWGLLSSSIYPADEPELPATLHIRRALGGAQWSIVVSIIAGIIAFALRSTGAVSWWVALFFFLDNFLTFTLGAFLPLGFTDGSTILYWRKKA